MTLLVMEQEFDTARHEEAVSTACGQQHMKVKGRRKKNLALLVLESDAKL